MEMERLVVLVGSSPTSPFAVPRAGGMYEAFPHVHKKG